MKHKILIFALAMIMIFTVVTPVVATTPVVIVDNKKITFDVPPVIEENHTLVPLRAIFEALDAQVEWDSANKTVTAIKDDIVILLIINQPTAYKNVTSDQIDISAFDLDVPSKIIKGRTMVPLRFICESLGAEVDWDEDTKTVTITSIN